MNWMVRMASAVLGIALLTSFVHASGEESPTRRRPGTGAGAMTTRSDSGTQPRPRHAAATAHPSRQRALPSADISAYRGLGTWVDVHDARVYRRPHAAVRKMKRRGVRTLYLETAHYNTRGQIHRPDATARLIHAAHREGLDVIAWYLPSFTDVHRDFRRSRAAIRFTTARGEQFDGFALDIEANLVRDVPTRNRRLFRLSRMIRGSVGPHYALGAIVPEAGAAYWRDFPYAEVRRHYDVFLPMAYHTFRIRGREEVERYARHNVRQIQIRSQDAEVPVHMIGGLAEDARPSEVHGFVKGAKARTAVGVSLYDFDTMQNRQWKALARRAGTP